MSKFITAMAGPKNTVIYTDSDGKKIEYSKGDRTWRNNNPGNLVSGDVSRRNHQIGEASGFAVFPDYETGHNAHIDCLKTTYKNATLESLMSDYAPKHENDTAKYLRFLIKKVGVAKDQKINELTPEQFEKLWQAIEQMKQGTVRELSWNIWDVIWEKNTDILKLILAETPNINIKDGEGRSPICKCCLIGYEAGVREIFARFSATDINAPDKYGDTPLILAVKCKSPEIVTILVDCPGINVNYQTPYYGDTALMFAVARGMRPIVEILLYRGSANKEIRDHSGYSAFDRAKLEGITELLAILKTDSPAADT